MLPPRFELHRPESLDHALELLERYGEDASPYAGGTELLIAMKARVLRYAHIVDLKRVRELGGIAPTRDGGISIGALTTHHQLATSTLVREKLPAYAALSEHVANIRVRVMGTLGGNLCFAEPHADPPPLLCALRAQAVLAGPGGWRKVPITEFIQGEFTTARAAGELLVRIEVPPLGAGDRAAYRSFGQLERPAAGVAAVRRGRDEWEFWVGAATPRPMLLACAPDDVSDAASSLEAHDDLHGSAEYKRHLVGVLAQRAAQACLP